VKAGLAEDTIVLTIERSASEFDTSPPGLIALKQNEVSQKIMDAMIKAGTPETAPPSVPSPATSGEPKQPQGTNGKWMVTDEVSPMDGSRSVALLLPAEQSIPGVIGTAVVPKLVIRCRGGQTDVFVATQTVLPIDWEDAGKFPVRLRFDDEAPFSESWSPSTGNDSLFAPDPERMARELAASKQLAFEFAPADSLPVATWFDLTGLQAQLNQAKGGCPGWEGQTSTPAVGGAPAPAQGGSGTGSPGVSSARNIYVDDPHAFGYVAPGHIKKGLRKSSCLHLVDDRSEADIVLTPVQKEGLGDLKWIFTDPKTGKRVGDWEMTFFPNSKKVEEALGCR